jgi:hypothetical protein
MTWSGVAIVENQAMNFNKYFDAPQKLLTSVTLVRTGHFMMASIFSISILSSPQPITYPKYNKD